VANSAQHPQPGSGLGEQAAAIYGVRPEFPKKNPTLSQKRIFPYDSCYFPKRIFLYDRGNNCHTEIFVFGKDLVFFEVAAQRE
jgi:hypothetical protein